MRTVLTITLSIVVGVVAGLLIGKIPVLELKLKDEVSLSNILSIVITASAILAAPFITKSLIEDNRTLKETLLSDLNAFLAATNKIHDRFKRIYQNGEIGDLERHELIGMFVQCDRNLHALKQLIEDNGTASTKQLFESLQYQYFTYWDFMTGEAVTGAESTQISEETNNEEFNLNNAISFACADLKSNIIGL